MTPNDQEAVAHPEWCPVGAPDEPNAHCGHWYDCEPCHRCGDDMRDPGCDCARCWAARTIRPGRFPDQTILADPAQPDVMGNCWQTCIAGILDLPLEEVPHFVQMHQSMADVEASTRHWAAGHGYAMVRLGILEVDANADHVLTLLCGESPRGVHHAVIGRGTDVLHDPHPSKAGLGRITDVFAFLPLDPSTAMTAGRLRELATWLALCAEDTVALLGADHPSLKAITARRDALAAEGEA
jgi:hypothetical protein